MSSDGITHFYNLAQGNQLEYQNKPEFELAQKIEGWRLEDGHVCDLCQSSNVEVFDVEVDYVELYSFEKMKQKCMNESRLLFMLSYSKENKKIKVKPGGNPENNEPFWLNCFKEMIATINNLSETSFIEHPDGNFFICFTTGKNFNINELTVESFRYSGFFKSDLLRITKHASKEMGIYYDLYE